METNNAIESEFTPMEEAVMSCVQTAMATVGESATTQLFKTLESLILEEPDLARKLARPAVQAKLAEMGEKKKAASKEGDSGIWGLMPFFADLAKILK